MGIRELKIGLMLLVIFASGVFCGVLLDRKFGPREPGPARGRGGPPLLTGRDAAVLAEMTDQMKLTGQQQQRIGEILRDWSTKVKQNRQQTLKERFSFFESAMSSVRTNLTAEQLPVYQEMVERAHRRQRQMQNRAN
jgi:hypothetical protein